MIELTKEEEATLVKADYKGKKYAKKVYDSATNGELRAFIKHPETGRAIRVHPDLIKRMHNGETISIYEILMKKFD